MDNTTSKPTFSPYQCCTPLKQSALADSFDGILSDHRIANSIDDWAQAVLHHKQRSQLDGFRTVTLEHLKSRSRPRHEFIQVKIQYKHSHRFIRVDRSFQRNSTHVRDQYRDLLRGGSLPADDTIIITSTPHYHDSFPLYAMSFDPKHAPTILDLAIVLLAVTSSAPVYNLESMCYWYARMVFDGVADAFGGRVIPKERPDLRGTFSGSIRLVERNGTFTLNGIGYLPRLRRFLPLPTRQALLDEISRIRGEFESEWELEERKEIIEELPVQEVRQYVIAKCPKLTYISFNSAFRAFPHSPSR